MYRGKWRESGRGAKLGQVGLKPRVGGGAWAVLARQSRDGVKGIILMVLFDDEPLVWPVFDYYWLIFDDPM